MFRFFYFLSDARPRAFPGPTRALARVLSLLPKRRNLSAPVLDTPGKNPAEGGRRSKIFGFGQPLVLRLRSPCCLQLRSTRSWPSGHLRPSAYPTPTTAKPAVVGDPAAPVLLLLHHPCP